MLAAAAGEWVARRRIGWGRALRSLWPVLAGPLALAPCAPLLLSQRQSLEVATWVPALNASQTLDFLCQLLAPPTVVGVLAIWYLAALFSKGVEGVWRAPRSVFSLTSLSGVALVLVVVSMLVQPMLIARYSIAAVLCSAAVASVLSARLSRRSAWAAMGLVLAVGATTSAGLSERAMWGPAELDRIAADLRALPAPWAAAPAVFASRFHFYPLVYIDPELRSRSFLFDFDTAADTPMPDRLVFERDQGRSVAACYSQFLVMNLASPQAPDQFIFIGADTDLPSLLPELKGYSMRKSSRWIYEVRRDAP